MDERLQQQLDRIEEKLDKHMERIAKLDVEVSWLKKFLGVVTTAVIGSIVAAIKNLFGSN